MTPRTGLATARRHLARSGAVALITTLGLVLAAQPALASPPQKPVFKTWGATAAVKAQLILGNTLYIGGAFTNVISPDGLTTTSRQHLAAIDLTTGGLLSWAPTTNGTVEALATDGTNIIVGGSFTNINGTSRTRIGAVDQSGAVIPWATGANDTVSALFVSGSTVYVGGKFTTMGGQSRQRLGAVTTAGALLSWTASANDRVKALTMAGGAVIAGGYFTELNGQNQRHIVRLDAVSGATLPWAYQSSDEVFGLVTGPDGNVYAAIAGLLGKVRSWTSTGQLRWTTGTDGDVNAVTYYNGQVIAGGHFITLKDQTFTIPRLAALDPSNGAPDPTWVPKPNKQIWAFATDGTNLAVGGIFTNVSNGTYRRVALFR
ncbi:MAG TPA: hypothetical protein VH989_00610 [Actinomycetota bacterium]